MTPRERLRAVLRGEIPDRVPVCPDISNMVPCRLAGKPFWDVYAFKDPPLWKAHIDALKYFELDGGFELYDFGPVDPVDGTRDTTEERVVFRWRDGRFATQRYQPHEGQWSAAVTVYTADNPPATNVAPEKLGLPSVPSEWEPMTGARKLPEGRDLWLEIRRALGEQGVLGVWSGMATTLLNSVQDVYDYQDDPRPFHDRAERMRENVRRRMKLIALMDPRPDFLLCGGSGTLVFQTPTIFRNLVLPLLRETTRLAADLGMPTHVHSCGPERELVRMAAEETALTVIDPLEVPPMGDCDLAALKLGFGERIILKGNLHTTEIMLHGSAADVAAASRKAIDDAAAGGRFILSTGDQCGRDTPDENIRAMVEIARTYGRY